MESIYVWWDRNFREQFQEPLLNALNEIIRLGEDFSDHFDIGILGNFSFGDMKYENAEWYFDSSLDHQREQVNASSILNKCATEHWPNQKPHFHVIGTSHNLWNGTSSNEFVFGLTRPGFGTITSYNIMVKQYESDAPLVYLILALHENAHLFWAPDATRRKDLHYALGAHCKLVDCALGQVNVGGRPDALEAGREILRRHEATGDYFCSDCITDIVKGKRNCVRAKSY